MAQVIMTNVASLNSQRQLNKSQSSLNTSLERLSSGLRINSAKDDAAGLAISDRMTSQITGMTQAARNANDGISLAQTAEGDLAAITNNLQRIRELSVQSANATNSSSDRQALQTEVSQLTAEIDRVASQSSFNGVKLLDGTFASKAFQVGANAGQTIVVGSVASARTASIGGYQGTGTGPVTGTAFGAGDLQLTVGTNAAVAVGASVAGDATAGVTASSAYAKAAAINSSGAAVTATASTSVAAAAQTVAALSGTITINGQTTSSITTTVGGAAAARADTVTAINAMSAKTGVVATDTGTGVSLKAADGRDIITSFTTMTEASVGMAAAGTTKGTLTLSSAESSVAAGGTGATAAGLAATVTMTLQTVSTIDISTVDGATKALSTLDGALQQIDSNRANLGALQNRFTSVVSTLQTTSENLSASRSRILDTDFAAETATMTKSNILQQAGTAMLAQANSAPQNVLSLLK